MADDKTRKDSNREDQIKKSDRDKFNEKFVERVERPSSWPPPPPSEKKKN